MLADTSAGAAASGAETLHSRKYAGVLYLSKGWKSAWGGALVDLELEAEMVPAYNSLVVFEARRHRRAAAPTAPPRRRAHRRAALPRPPRHRAAAGKATRRHAPVTASRNAPRHAHAATACPLRHARPRRAGAAHALRGARAECDEAATVALRMVARAGPALRARRG